MDEYPDDLHDIFPWIKPGEYKRVEADEDRCLEVDCRSDTYTEPLRRGG